MVESNKMHQLVYVLERKPIDKGNITKVYNHDKSLESGDKDRTRSVGDLEAVLVVDATPGVGEFYGGERGQSVYVIGAREVGSRERLSVWRVRFVDHPEHYHIFTSAYVSKFVPLEAYKEIMKNIKTADDLVELRELINKFYNTNC